MNFSPLPASMTNQSPVAQVSSGIPQYNIEELRINIIKAQEACNITSLTFFSKIEPIIIALSKFDYYNKIDNYAERKLTNLGYYVLDKFDVSNAHQFQIDAQPFLMFQTNNPHSYFILKDVPATVSFDTMYKEPSYMQFTVDMNEKKAFVVQKSTPFTEETLTELNNSVTQQYGITLMQTLQHLQATDLLTRQYVSEIDIKKFKLEKL